MLRVLPLRHHTEDTPSAPRAKLHVVPDPPPLPEPVGRHERRMRDEGGPDDRAVYTCSCGYLFEAPVSASVACPRCGGEQAW